MRPWLRWGHVIKNKLLFYQKVDQPFVIKKYNNRMEFKEEPWGQYNGNDVKLFTVSDSKR